MLPKLEASEPDVTESPGFVRWTKSNLTRIRKVFNQTDPIPPHDSKIVLSQVEASETKATESPELVRRSILRMARKREAAKHGDLVRPHNSKTANNVHKGILVPDIRRVDVKETDEAESDSALDADRVIVSFEDWRDANEGSFERTLRLLDEE